MNCWAEVPTRRSALLAGMLSATNRRRRTSVKPAIGSTVLYCRSLLVTLSNAASQCRLINFRGSSDAPGPPKLQLVAFGKLERSLSIRVTSARLRHGVLICGETRVPGTETEGVAASYAPRCETNVPRPISPRVQPLSAKDLIAAVTVVKLTPRSDARARTVGSRSPGFN